MVLLWWSDAVHSCLASLKDICISLRGRSIFLNLVEGRYWEVAELFEDCQRRLIATAYMFARWLRLVGLQPVGRLYTVIVIAYFVPLFSASRISCRQGLHWVMSQLSCNRHICLHQVM